MRHVVTVCLTALVGSLAAQTAPGNPEPRPVPAPAPRTLADGLVRHQIEQDRLRPPRLESGLELGAGTGPLVLLVRRADGSLQVHEIDRGGDHGPAVTKTNLRNGGAIPAEPALAEPPVAPTQAAGQPPPAAAVPATPPEPATIELRCLGEDLVLGTTAAPAALRGRAFDRGALATWLRQLAATTHGTTVAGRLVLQVHAEVPMQAALTVWEVARESGFAVPMWSPQGTVGPALDEAARELVHGLPKRFEWQVRHLLPARQPVAEGELLVLLDGPATFGAMAPLLCEFAFAGLWQISFVGARDARTRLKLPCHLPFDG